LSTNVVRNIREVLRRPPSEAELHCSKRRKAASTSGRAKQMPELPRHSGPFSSQAGLHVRAKTADGGRATRTVVLRNVRAAMRYATASRPRPSLRRSRMQRIMRHIGKNRSELLALKLSLLLPAARPRKQASIRFCLGAH
jgi:hypothetical protein